MAGALEDAPIELFGRSQWITFFDDFKEVDQDYSITNDWRITQLTSGSASILLSENGWLRLDVSVLNQGPIVQLDSNATAGNGNIAITPAAAVVDTSIDSEAIFASRFRIMDVSASTIFVGLAELNATSALLTTNRAVLTTSDNHAGFHQINSDVGALRFTAAGTSAGSALSITGTDVLQNPLTDGQIVEVAIRVIGTHRAIGYVRTQGTHNRWQKIGVIHTTNPWDDQMLISFGNVGAGAGDDLEIDYVFFATKRDLTL